VGDIARTYVVDYMSRDSDMNTCIAKHKFGDQQALSLQDYIETSLIQQTLTYSMQYCVCIVAPLPVAPCI